MKIDFNLEMAWEAQDLDMGKILTRGGEEVLLVRDVRSDQNEPVEYPILGVKLDNTLDFLSWTSEGVFWIGKESNDDLLYIEIT